MLTQIKKILLSLIFFQSLMCDIDCQITYIKGYSTGLHFNTVKHTFSNVARPLPTDYDILNYFFGEDENTQYLNFEDNKLTKKVHIDSLLPVFRKYIDNVIKGESNRTFATCKYFANSTTRRICEEIQELKNKYVDYNASSKISTKLNKLPNSSDKIWLQLQNAELIITDDPYSPEILSVYNRAKSDANNLPDFGQKGIAYLNIGDFIAKYQMNDSAIKMYYLARECYYNASKVSLTNYYYQGQISEKTANLFSSYDVSQAIEKSINYYISAATYYKAAGFDLASYQSYLSSLIERTYLLCNIDNSDEATNQQKRLENLAALKDWFYKFTENTNGKIKNIPWESVYIGFYSIASLLENDADTHAPLLYALESLKAAILSENADIVNSALSKVASIYTSMGKQESAIGYINLGLYLSEKLKDGNSYYEDILSKAQYFYTFSKYDSALIYANKLGTDTLAVTGSNFNFPTFIKVAHAATRLKIDVYTRLKKADSVRYYTGIFNNEDVSDLYPMYDLLQTESPAIINFIGDVKDHESAINDLYNASIRKKLHDSLAYSDSIRIIHDSLRHAEQINNRNAIKLEEQKSQKRLMIIVAIASCSITYILWRRKKADLRREIAELKLLNETALGHDHINHLDHLVGFAKALKDGNNGAFKYQLSPGKFYEFINDMNKYFTINYNLKSTLKNKLSLELELAKKYSLIFEKMKETPSKISIMTNSYFDAIGDIEIPKHTLINFISNSFRHGAMNREKIVIKVYAFKEGNDIIIIIEDDGVGFDSLNLETKEANRGINLVLQLVRKYNSMPDNKYKIVFSQDNIENKIENGVRTGVKVTYKLLKK